MLDVQNLTICPICREPLILGAEKNAYSCLNNHYFDVARQGYINLLTSNQKKSKLPGDSKDMVAARRLFLQNGHYKKISEKLNALIIADFLRSRLGPYAILDLGCGEGYYTGRLMADADRTASENSDPSQADYHDPVNYYGIDISKEAVKWASSDNKRAIWIVGTNYHLPLKNASFDCIFSVFSPVLWSECIRILKQKGLFVRILPGTRHLIEIRDIIYPKTILNEDAGKSEPPNGLQHLETEKIEYTIDLNQNELLELVQMTPHYWKTSQTDKNALKEFSALNVTVSMLIFIYQKS